jgi:hypothetical protein
VNSCGLKPTKEEEQQQQSVWNTATTLVMITLCITHKLSWRERERDPPALQQLCTPQRAQDLVHVFSDLRLAHKVNNIEFEEEMVSWMEEEEPNDD